MLMDEYRLALEFWGSALGQLLLAPLLAAATTYVRQLFQDVHTEVSAPLSSVPSNPHPSWPGC
jgi:hypothetical protein